MPQVAASETSWAEKLVQGQHPTQACAACPRPERGTRLDCAYPVDPFFPLRGVPMAEGPEEFSTLLARARAGDEGALAELARRYEPEVRLVARIRLGAALR